MTQVRTQEAFIEKAPDGRRKGVIKGRKIQISLTIPRELLDELDALARSVSQSRASLINLAIYNAVAGGLRIPVP
jgi:hypothetical protein